MNLEINKFLRLFTCFSIIISSFPTQLSSAQESMQSPESFSEVERSPEVDSLLIPESPLSPSITNESFFSGRKFKF